MAPQSLAGVTTAQMVLWDIIQNRPLLKLKIHPRPHTPLSSEWSHQEIENWFKQILSAPNTYPSRFLPPHPGPSGYVRLHFLLLPQLTHQYGWIEQRCSPAYLKSSRLGVGGRRHLCGNATLLLLKVAKATAIPCNTGSLYNPLDITRQVYLLWVVPLARLEKG